MKKNMNPLDRLVRSVAAIVIAILLLSGTITGTLGVVLGVVAIIFLATGIIGWCPLYAMLGLGTRGKVHPGKATS